MDDVAFVCALQTGEEFAAAVEKFYLPGEGDRVTGPSGGFVVFGNVSSEGGGDVGFYEGAALWEGEVGGFPEERAVEVSWVRCHNITLNAVLG